MKLDYEFLTGPEKRLLERIVDCRARNIDLWKSRMTNEEQSAADALVFRGWLWFGKTYTSYYSLTPAGVDAYDKWRRKSAV